jgi:hypothetical protein
MDADSQIALDAQQPCRAPAADRVLHDLPLRGYCIVRRINVSDREAEQRAALHADT